MTDRRPSPRFDVGAAIFALDLGRFNCRGDYVMPDGSKVPAERLGIRPAYGEVDEETLRRVGELSPHHLEARGRLRRMIADGTVYFASHTGEKMRSEVPAALADQERPRQPYSFRGQPCSLHQLRVVLADACQWAGQLPRMLMDDRAIYLRSEGGGGRFVKFTRAIGAEGVSVIDPDWIEE